MPPIRTTAIAASAVFAATRIWKRAREADLTGQVALVTGGSRGLGLAIARELVGHGCRVAICALDQKEIDRAIADLQSRGGDVFAQVCDVTDRDAVEAMVAAVTGHFGRIDLLVANAGIIDIEPVSALALDDIRRSIDVHLYGILHMVLAVLPQMRARGEGRIAAITSIGGRIAVPHLLPYSAGKFAAVGLSTALATELHREGITVSTVVPGLMRTGSHIQARFKGSPEQRKGDYAVFATGATFPALPDAESAAKTIVRGIRRGDPEIAFSLPFAIAGRVAGMAPNLTVRAMRIANAILPARADSTPDDEIVRGAEVAATLDSDLVDRLTAAGKPAIERFNQRQAPG